MTTCYPLVSDFDGTITENEFYALVLARRPGVPNYFSEYLAGRLTHFEAMASVFSNSPTEEATLAEMLREMRCDRVAFAGDGPLDLNPA